MLGLNGYTVMMEAVVRIVLADIIRQGVGPFGDGIAMTDFGAFREDGVAFSGRIGRCTDSPERGGYARGTGD
jgi:hypothetical protein